jgi:hypothetical protein
VLPGNALGVEVTTWLAEHAASVTNPNRKMIRIIGLENFIKKRAPSTDF